MVVIVHNINNFVYTAIGYPVSSQAGYPTDETGYRAGFPKQKRLDIWLAGYL